MSNVNVNLMVIFDAAFELCKQEGLHPESPSSKLSEGVSNHELKYIELSRKYKAGAEYSAVEQRAIDKVTTNNQEG